MRSSGASFCKNPNNDRITSSFGSEAVRNTFHDVQGKRIWHMPLEVLLGKILPWSALASSFAFVLAIILSK